jgi:hypothetical protein
VFVTVTAYVPASAGRSAAKVSILPVAPATGAPFLNH